MLFKREYMPGERITENALVKKFGVSRGPIREAIRMLVHDGLLVQNGSFINVFNPTIDDVIDLYRCKERLEPLAASLACKHISGDAKETLLDILDRTEKALENQQTNDEIAMINTEFHKLITQSSNNNQLIQFMEMIQAKNRYMRTALLDNYTRKEAFLEEHRMIAKAIIDGDEILAENKMKEHVLKDLKEWEILLQS